MEWIKVTEQLPEPGQTVLAYSKNGHIRIGYRFDDHAIIIWTRAEGCCQEDKRRPSDCCRGDIRRPTHWMPLPEVPKE